MFIKNSAISYKYNDYFALKEQYFTTTINLEFLTSFPYKFRAKLMIKNIVNTVSSAIKDTHGYDKLKLEGPFAKPIYYEDLQTIFEDGYIEEGLRQCVFNFFNLKVRMLYRKESDHSNGMTRLYYNPELDRSIFKFKGIPTKYLKDSVGKSCSLFKTLAYYQIKSKSGKVNLHDIDEKAFEMAAEVGLDFNSIIRKKELIQIEKSLNLRLLVVYTNSLNKTFNVYYKTIQHKNELDENVVILLLCDNTFYYLPSITSVIFKLPKSGFCNNCLTFFNNILNHSLECIHCCNQCKAYSCNALNFNIPHNEKKVCTKCNREFNKDDCYENHISNGSLPNSKTVCGIIKKCNNCGDDKIPYMRFIQKHVCKIRSSENSTGEKTKKADKEMDYANKKMKILKETSQLNLTDGDSNINTTNFNEMDNKICQSISKKGTDNLVGKEKVGADVGIQPVTLPQCFVQQNVKYNTYDILNKKDNSKSQVLSNKRSTVDNASTERNLKCLVCHESDKENIIKLQNHLFFGPIKCLECGWIIYDCSNFVQMLKRLLNCQHKNLSWFGDPIEYIKGCLNYNLSSLETENLLEEYLQALEPLSKIKPWSIAIHICRKKLDSFSEVTLDNSNTIKTETVKWEDNIVGKSVQSLVADSRIFPLIKHPALAPHDERYLVVETLINECPECYLTIKTKYFKNSFSNQSIFYYECRGCHLPIYFIFEPPDYSLKLELKNIYPQT